MPLRTRIFRLSSLAFLATACLAQSPRAVPARLALPAGALGTVSGPGIEAPALYEFLRQVKDLPEPIASQGIPYDRQVLLAQPEAFVGDLVTLVGQYHDTDQVRLRDAPEDQPGLAWSTITLGEGREPVQVITLGPRPQFKRLAWVRCTGYFYRVRLDASQAGARHGPAATAPADAVRVPVLVGWILGETSPPPLPARPTGSWQIFGAVTAAVLVLFFFAWTMSRRRTDWRSRVAEQRRRQRQLDSSGENGFDEYNE